MRISARADYAVRAVLELAVRQGDAPVKAEKIAAVQDIPHTFLEGVTLSDLATDTLPEPVRQLAAGPEAWENP
ncbi:Rrf2 family transcriptional regulator [Streptomyces sp. NPDC002619]|uniref:Rrf2 family transcriptional regulator n=1 Tax=Streptomyces sp. NPDC002619 TaxID=3364655 RepID=UPI0036C93397